MTYLLPRKNTPMLNWPHIRQILQQFCQQHVYGFRFWHAIWVAVILHVVALFVYALWSEPDVVDVPFKPIHIKLGDVLVAPPPQAVAVPDVNVTMAQEAPVSPAAPPTPPVAIPVKKPTPPQEPAPPRDDVPELLEELLTDALELLPDILPEPEPEEPQPEPDPQEIVEPSPPVDAQRTAAPNNAHPTQTPSPPTKQDVGSQQGNRKVSGDNPQLNYRQLLSLWVEKHKQYPDVARKAGVTGEAVIRLDIEQSGYITRYNLDKKTGHPILDDAVIAMIERANPVPPIPPTESARAFRIAIRFSID